MAFKPSPEPPLLADGNFDEGSISHIEASEVDSMEETLHQMSMFRDYVPAQKRLMDRMNQILGEQHLKNWYKTALLKLLERLIEIKYYAHSLF